MTMSVACGDGECPRHTAVVLFYKYFLPSSNNNDAALLVERPEFFLPKMQVYQRELGIRLGLKGRILLSLEGINGTLSAPSESLLDEYIQAMECFDLKRECGEPCEESRSITHHAESLFANTDWKKSTVDKDTAEPFPDLKISIAKEIVSTGGEVDVSELQTLGGKHLTPREFHKTLQESPDAVLIDVRNTFEHEIGHFINPASNQPALRPDMVTFSSFDSTFLKKHAESLRDKKILIYCTGGIRCEKASVLMRKRGIEDVSQLQGGIHRYLEDYGDSGFFRGKNFVFDQRVALTPAASREGEETLKEQAVGRCIECETPFDEVSGSRICTVCRDLVLVCPNCQVKHREYHCRRHSSWKACYFTFLEIFTKEELLAQRAELEKFREALVPHKKNVRRTLSRQITKVNDRIGKLEHGETGVDKNAPRRCRTCEQPRTICDGLCWGFWRHSDASTVGQNCKVKSTSVSSSGSKPTSA
jgi:UPF0176 protein